MAFVPNYLNLIKSYFKNLVLTSTGSVRTIYELLNDGLVDQALEQFTNNDDAVDEAIKEYNPETHKVMNRPNKPRKNERPYITEKLPRCRQQYINEVELFFLLGNPIIWKKEEGDDEAYKLFTDFLSDVHFDSRMRKAKRLAGSETESAKLYRLYREQQPDGNYKVGCQCVVLARSEGYKLRPMFDQYGNLLAFAYGYLLNEGTSSVMHWDIQTPELLFYCKKSRLGGWEVKTETNPTGKINVIYYKQRKAWQGVQPRIDREELLDSKVGDTNNYFADPIATATADVVQLMQDPETSGKLIQMQGANSRFEYINPPQSSELRESEKQDLNQSILFDSYTPDFSYENLKGFGAMSGAAIKNAMLLGYIKRDNRKEDYGETTERDKNLIIAILKYLHPDKLKALDELKVTHEFAEPFAEDMTARYNDIISLYNAGLLSLEEAVPLLAICNTPEAEIKRLQEKAREEREAQQKQIQPSPVKEQG